MAQGDTNAAAGLEHFQAAAREMIAACRSMLDAAEELVEDPDAARQAFGAFGDVVRRAARDAASFATGAAAGARPPDDDPPVEHIDVD